MTPIYYNKTKIGENGIQYVFRLFDINVWVSTHDVNIGWFRLFGKGLGWKNIDEIPLAFSYRNGYKKYIMIGKWAISYLPFNKSKQSLHECFVVIQAGHEGIEQLVYATQDGSDASAKVKELRKDIFNAIEHRKKVLEEFGEGEDEDYHDAWDRMYFDKKITHKEHSDSKYRDPDAYCVQKWDGEKFQCDCEALGCKPSKQWWM